MYFYLKKMILERKIPLKYWLNTIKWDILIVSLFSLAVFFTSEYLINLSIPISIGAFLGTAISLLLSFKLGQSYDRWWEARKIWGAIVNDSRTFVTQIKSFTNNENINITKSLAFRQIAWCYSLAQSLRDENSLKNIDEFISKEELNKIRDQKNIPLAFLDIQSSEVSVLHKQKIINDFQQIQIDNTILRLCASMGKTERIKNTAFPKTYRLTLHLFIYIFLITLSFALTEMHSFIEIPLMIIISIPFFLLEKIAFNIQDPFKNKPTDTPMTSICRTIEINIKQQLGENKIPKPIETEKFYIL
jgi:ion channel-forming bestrophin family protein